MLLNNLYKEFCLLTGLNESVYEIVFSNISDVLDKIKNITWISLVYLDKESNNHTKFNFLTQEKVPSYVVELMHNAFEDYYTVPDSIVLTITLKYKDTEYNIITNSSGTQIPPEISFIKDYNIFSIFCADKEVYDIFEEFDNIFKFVLKLKQTNKNIFPPLAKRFDTLAAKTSIINKEIDNTKISSLQLKSENIKNKMEETLVNINNISKNREALIKNKNEIFSGVNSRETLLGDREKFVIEFETLQETINNNKKREKHFDDVLKDVNAEISDCILRIEEGNNEDVNSLKEYLELNKRKKEVYDIEKKSINKDIKEIESIANDMKNRIKNIEDTLSRIDTYTLDDVKIISKKIESLEQEQDKQYNILLTMETEFKNTKKQINDNSIKVEVGKSYGDLTMQGVENTAIINHLASSQQPISITTVLNYLRYYYAYYTTIVSENMLNNDSKLKPELAQSIASKIVLTEKFNISFNNLFSFYNLSGNNIDNVIIITK